MSDCISTKFFTSRQKNHLKQRWQGKNENWLTRMQICISVFLQSGASSFKFVASSKFASSLLTRIVGPGSARRPPLHIQMQSKLLHWTCMGASSKFASSFLFALPGHAARNRLGPRSPKKFPRLSGWEPGGSASSGSLGFALLLRLVY